MTENSPARAPRFRDHGEQLWTFLDEVWVRCPTCGSAGKVLTEQPYHQNTPSFTCGHCATRLSGRRSHWYGPRQGVAARRCGRCGRQLRSELTGRTKVVEHVDLQCPGCGAVSAAPVTWQFKLGDLPCEPAFGLSLHLQVPCCGQILWVYNPDHLTLLTDYVSATLRERVANQNRSLVSRLPRWLKQASHREAVLKALHRLASMTQ